MRFTALIPSLLLSVSEAGPLRPSPNNDLDRRSQPRPPRLWPREFSLNRTATSSSTSSSLTPTTSTSTSTTTVLEGPAGTSAVGGRTTVVTIALSSLLGSHNGTAPPTQTTKSTGTGTGTGTSTTANKSTGPATSAQSSEPPASDKRPTETATRGGSSRVTPSPFMSSGALVTPPGTDGGGQATSEISSSASPTHRAATGSPNTGVPTAIASAPRASGTVSAETYQKNLVSAQKYNALFATLNEQSACSPSQAACIGGSVAKCGSDGSFTTVTSCTGGTMCYAIPLNTTQGVVLTCIDTASAKSILGSLLADPPAESSGGSGTSKSSATSSSQGPASTAAVQTTTVTQTVPGTTVTIQITATLPASLSSMSPSATSTFITKSTILTVIPVPASSLSMDPHSAAAAAAATPAPSDVDNKSRGGSQPVTVFVTVTQTEKEVLTSTVTTTATIVVRG